MATNTRKRNGAEALSDALSAHFETTNELMRVQFQGVRDQFAIVHDAIASAKADVQNDFTTVREDTTSLREDHQALAKRVWIGTGILVAAEAALAYLGIGHGGKS